jgi:hypothetical protein
LEVDIKVLNGGLSPAHIAQRLRTGVASESVIESEPH